MIRGYEVHFYQGTEGLPTLWESYMEDNGAVLLERGRFTGPNKIPGILQQVNNMTLANNYYRESIKVMLETLSRPDEKFECIPI